MRTTKALLLSSVVLLATFPGCTTTGGVSLRPDGTPGPQECPEEAKRMMRALKLRVGDAAWVDLDANQLDAKQVTLYDGPIESILKDDFGTLESTTRLYGQVWTSGAQVVIRYYEAHPPDSEKFPIGGPAQPGPNAEAARVEARYGHPRRLHRSGLRRRCLPLGWIISICPAHGVCMAGHLTGTFPKTTPLNTVDAKEASNSSYA